jgi:hypothetical protein
MTFHQILNPHPPFAPFGEEVEVELMSSVVVDALVTAIDEDKVLLVC